MRRAFDDANDALRAELESVKRERDEALSDRDAWAKLCGAKDCYTPSSAKTYEALRESEGQLRTLLEETKQLIYEIAEDGAEFPKHSRAKEARRLRLMVEEALKTSEAKSNTTL